MQPVIAIPAYDPPPILMDVVRELVTHGVQRILVVDDGSSPEYASLFGRIEAIPQVVVLRHDHNQGKGRALKTAFGHVLSMHTDCPGVVTADADGQHRPTDILRASRALVETPETLILGSRSFGIGVPLRSRVGNKAAQLLFRMVSGIFLRDTQTGLRGIPLACLGDILALPGDGYDLELTILLWAARKGRALRSIDIETVYVDGNAESHFHPLRDSLAVCRAVLRHVRSRTGDNP